jgi:hydroxypyruvate isomerase
MPKFAANLTMLFNELPFLDRFAAAKAAGFGGVEYLFPYDFEKGALGEQLQLHGLTQVLHNLPAGNWAAGERGIAIFPDRVDEFRDGVLRAVDYAKALGCRQLNCLVGVAPPDADVHELNEVLLKNLRFAAAALAREHIRLLIEPINTLDIPGFFLKRTEQAARIISDVQSDNLFIQYDIYHMQVMEGDIARTLQKHLARIAHVQLADNPGRHEPGTGEINYPFLFKYLDEIGYRGWIGCEYKPKATTAEGLAWYAAQTVDA